MTWVYIFGGITVFGWILQLIFSPKRAARQIAETGEKLYSNKHEYAEVNPKQFPDLDHAFYDRVQAELEALGFRHAGDVEDVTLSRQFPSMRTFIRRMIGADGTVMGGIYQVKYRGFLRLLALFGVLPRQPYYLDMETEFADGTFLVTSNSEGCNLSQPPPGITNQPRPQWTTTSDLLADHRKGLVELLQRGVPAVELVTGADYQASQDRMQELKNRQQRAQGFIDLEQNKAISKTHGSSETNAELLAELTALQKQRAQTVPMTPPPLPPTQRSDQIAA